MLGKLLYSNGRIFVLGSWGPAFNSHLGRLCIRTGKLAPYIRNSFSLKNGLTWLRNRVRAIGRFMQGACGMLVYLTDKYKSLACILMGESNTIVSAYIL